MGCKNDKGVVRNFLLSASLENEKETSSANCLTFDKSGVVLAVGYDSGALKFMNIKNLKNADSINTENQDAILDLVFDSENKCLITCSADKTFRIFSNDDLKV